MDYREILRHQLQKRQEMNPKYSMRAFALKLSLSPSKVSEVLSGKKRLSVERAEDIANRLALRQLEKELFVLSARIESSSKKIERAELTEQMRELSRQISAKRTTQRNAWYFGAIRALSDAESNSGVLQRMLGITALQVENAKRYIKRIAKLHPDREQMSFEPMSIFRRVEEHLYSEAELAIEADFLIISQGDQEEMERKIRSIIATYKLKAKAASPENLKMIYWGCLSLNK